MDMSIDNYQWHEFFPNGDTPSSSSFTNYITVFLSPKPWFYSTLLTKLKEFI